MTALKCDICGGKLTAKPGGLFECEYCGMQYDKTRIQEMVQEIKGTVKVEGTVQVQGTVAVDNKANKENLLKRIAICAQDEDFPKISNLAEELLKLDPECGEAYLWQVAAQYKCSQAEGLYRLFPEDLKKIQGSAPWKNALRYLDAAQSAAANQRLNEALDYWNKPDPALKERFDLVQPARDLLFPVGNALLGLRSDGTVLVSHAQNMNWLAPVAQWTGVKKLLVCDCVLALCWDGRILGVSDSDTGNKLLEKVKAWENRKEKIIDMVAEQNIAAALFENGELRCTEDQYNAGTFYFGRARGWHDVERIHIMRRTVENRTGTFYGKNIFPKLNVVMFLGLTRAGKVLCSPSGYNLGSVPRMDVFLGIPWWERREGIVKISNDCSALLYRDGTVEENTFRDADRKYLDFGLSDTGRITNFFITYRQTFRERNLLSVAGDFALRADGTILPSEQRQASDCVKKMGITNWKNIAALQEIFSRHGRGMLGVQDDGHVLLAWSGNAPEGIHVDNWRLFNSLETIQQERKHAQQLCLAEAEEQRRKLEEEERRKQEEARKKQEELQRMMLERRQAGLCQHCGGTFKGLFSKKCTSCGSPKDY